MGIKQSFCADCRTTNYIRNADRQQQNLIQKFQEKIRTLQKLEANYVQKIEKQKQKIEKEIKQGMLQESKQILRKCHYFQHILKNIQRGLNILNKRLLSIQKTNSQNSDLAECKQIYETKMDLKVVVDFIDKLKSNQRITRQIFKDNQLFYDRQSTVQDQQHNLNQLFIELKNIVQVKRDLLSQSKYLTSTFGKKQQIAQHYVKNRRSMINFCKEQYNFTLSQEGYSLYHTDVPIDMSQFVKHDWTNLECLYLDGCRIGDHEWKILVKHAHLFLTLKSLEIQDNSISNVNAQDLLAFKQLRDITFCYKKWKNPLSSQSKINLQKFKAHHPWINVQLF